MRLPTPYRTARPITWKCRRLRSGCGKPARRRRPNGGLAVSPTDADNACDVSASLTIAHRTATLLETTMAIRKILLLTSAAAVGGLMLSGAAQAQSNTALTGKVTSAQEPVMEGVLVSAKRDGSTITTTVVTDDKGVYSFPADRLAPGHYTLSIRAVGYQLDGAKAADITAGAPATADITLGKS